MDHTVDLTEGSVYREYVFLMLPLLLGNILQQFYNAADAWIIGRYVGQNAFAAVGVGGTVMNLFLFLLAGCCSGFSVLFAQFYGAHDLPSFRKESYLSVVYGGGLTLILSALALVSLPALLRLIQTPEAIFALCRSYLAIVCCGLIAAYAYNLCAAILRAVGNTVAALTILAVSMGLNIVLDLWFVAGLGWGVRGAAWATVLAQLLSAALCFLYLKLVLPQLLFGREDAKIDRVLLKQSLSFGLLSALHQSSLYIGKLLVQGAVNSMGVELVTAYTATTRIEGFANSFGDSGSAAVSIFIAQNVGHGNRQRTGEGFQKGFRLLLGIGLVISAIMFFTAGGSMTLMTGEEAGTVMDNGRSYLRLIALFYPLCFIGNAMVGWFRGLGLVNVPVIGTCLHIAIRVILSWLLIGKMALPAVALATGVGWVFVVLFQRVMAKLDRRSVKHLPSGRISS